MEHLFDEAGLERDYLDVLLGRGIDTVEALRALSRSDLREIIPERGVRASLQSALRSHARRAGASSSSKRLSTSSVRSTRTPAASSSRVSASSIRRKEGSSLRAPKTATPTSDRRSGSRARRSAAAASASSGGRTTRGRSANAEDADDQSKRSASPSASRRTPRTRSPKPRSRDTRSGERKESSSSRRRDRESALTSRRSKRTGSPSASRGSTKASASPATPIGATAASRSGSPSLSGSRPRRGSRAPAREHRDRERSRRDDSDRDRSRRDESVSSSGGREKARRPRRGSESTTAKYALLSRQLESKPTGKLTSSDDIDQLVLHLHRELEPLRKALSPKANSLDVVPLQDDERELLEESLDMIESLCSSSKGGASRSGGGSSRRHASNKRERRQVEQACRFSMDARKVLQLISQECSQWISLLHSLKTRRQVVQSPRKGHLIRDSFRTCLRVMMGVAAALPQSSSEGVRSVESIFEQSAEGLFSELSSTLRGDAVKWESADWKTLGDGLVSEVLEIERTVFSATNGDSGKSKSSNTDVFLSALFRVISSSVDRWISSRIERPLRKRGFLLDLLEEDKSLRKTLSTIGGLCARVAAEMGNRSWVQDHILSHEKHKELLASAPDVAEHLGGFAVAHLDERAEKHRAAIFAVGENRLFAAFRAEMGQFRDLFFDYLKLLPHEAVSIGICSAFFKHAAAIERELFDVQPKEFEVIDLGSWKHLRPSEKSRKKKSNDPRASRLRETLCAQYREMSDAHSLVEAVRRDVEEKLEKWNSPVLKPFQRKVGRSEVSFAAEASPIVEAIARSIVFKELDFSEMYTRDPADHKLKSVNHTVIGELMQVLNVLKRQVPEEGMKLVAFALLIAFVKILELLFLESDRSFRSQDSNVLRDDLATVYTLFGQFANLSPLAASHQVRVVEVILAHIAKQPKELIALHRGLANPSGSRSKSRMEDDDEMDILSAFVEDSKDSEPLPFANSESPNVKATGGEGGSLSLSATGALKLIAHRETELERRYAEITGADYIPTRDKKQLKAMRQYESESVLGGFKKIPLLGDEASSESKKKGKALLSRVADTREGSVSRSAASHGESTKFVGSADDDTDVVIDEVYENENRESNKWVPATEVPHYSDETAAYKTSLKDVPPKAASGMAWQWTTEWIVLYPSQHEIQTNAEEIDPKGWRYQKSFESEKRFIRAHKKTGDKARQRRWFRVRILVRKVGGDEAKGDSETAACYQLLTKHMSQIAWHLHANRLLDYPPSQEVGGNSRVDPRGSPPSGRSERSGDSSFSVDGEVATHVVCGTTETANEQRENAVKLKHWLRLTSFDSSVTKKKRKLDALIDDLLTNLKALMKKCLRLDADIFSVFESQTATGKTLYQEDELESIESDLSKVLEAVTVLKAMDVSDNITSFTMLRFLIELVDSQKEKDQETLDLLIGFELFCEDAKEAGALHHLTVSPLDELLALFDDFEALGFDNLFDFGAGAGGGGGGGASDDSWKKYASSSECQDIAKSLVKTMSTWCKNYHVIYDIDAVLVGKAFLVFDRLVNLVNKDCKLEFRFGGIVRKQMQASMKTAYKKIRFEGDLPDLTSDFDEDQWDSFSERIMGLISREVEEYLPHFKDLDISNPIKYTISVLVPLLAEDLNYAFEAADNGKLDHEIHLKVLEFCHQVRVKVSSPSWRKVDALPEDVVAQQLELLPSASKIVQANFRIWRDAQRVNLKNSVAEIFKKEPSFDDSVDFMTILHGIKTSAMEGLKTYPDGVVDMETCRLFATLVKEYIDEFVGEARKSSASVREVLLAAQTATALGDEDDDDYDDRPNFVESDETLSEDSIPTAETFFVHYINLCYIRDRLSDFEAEFTEFYDSLGEHEARDDSTNAPPLDFGIRLVEDASISALRVLAYRLIYLDYGQKLIAEQWLLLDDDDEELGTHTDDLLNEFQKTFETYKEQADERLDNSVYKARILQAVYAVLMSLLEWVLVGASDPDSEFFRFFDKDDVEDMRGDHDAVTQAFIDIGTSENDINNSFEDEINNCFEGLAVLTLINSFEMPGKELVDTHKELLDEARHDRSMLQRSQSAIRSASAYVHEATSNLRPSGDGGLELTMGGWLRVIEHHRSKTCEKYVKKNPMKALTIGSDELPGVAQIKTNHALVAQLVLLQVQLNIFQKALDEDMCADTPSDSFRDILRMLGEHGRRCDRGDLERTTFLNDEESTATAQEIFEAAKAMTANIYAYGNDEAVAEVMSLCLEACVKVGTLLDRCKKMDFDSIEFMTQLLKHSTTLKWTEMRKKFPKKMLSWSPSDFADFYAKHFEEWFTSNVCVWSQKLQAKLELQIPGQFTVGVACGNLAKELTAFTSSSKDVTSRTLHAALEVSNHVREFLQAVKGPDDIEGRIAEAQVMPCAMLKEKIASFPDPSEVLREGLEKSNAKKLKEIKQRVRQNFQDENWGDIAPPLSLSTVMQNIIAEITSQQNVYLEKVTKLPPKFITNAICKDYFSVIDGILDAAIKETNQLCGTSEEFEQILDEAEKARDGASSAETFVSLVEHRWSEHHKANDRAMPPAALVFGFYIDMEALKVLLQEQREEFFDVLFENSIECQVIPESINTCARASSDLLTLGCRFLVLEGIGDALLGGAYRHTPFESIASELQLLASESVPKLHQLLEKHSQLHTYATECLFMAAVAAFERVLTKPGRVFEQSSYDVLHKDFKALCKSFSKLIDTKRFLKGEPLVSDVQFLVKALDMDKDDLKDAHKKASESNRAEKRARGEKLLRLFGNMKSVSIKRYAESLRA